MEKSLRGDIPPTLLKSAPVHKQSIVYLESRILLIFLWQIVNVIIHLVGVQGAQVPDIRICVKYEATIWGSKIALSVFGQFDKEFRDKSQPSDRI